MTEVLVPSRSTPGEFHRVLVGVDGSTSCNCPGATHRGKCWAQRQVKEQMSNEEQAIVPVKVTPPVSLVPRREDLAAIADLSRSIMGARGQMFPRELDTPGKVYAVMAYGLEMGVRPMQALRSIYIVNGRPQPSAELMAGIVQANEPTISFEILELDETKCRMRIKRPARDVVGEYTYTIEDAKRANLVKGNNPWATFPKDMLRHACMKRLCRAYAPDLVNGLDPIALANDEESAQPGYIEASFTEPATTPAAPAEDSEPEGVDTATGEVLEGEFTEEPDEPEDAPAALNAEPLGEEALNAAVAWLDECASEAKVDRSDVLEKLNADIVQVAADLPAAKAKWAAMHPQAPAREPRKAPPPPSVDDCTNLGTLLTYFLRRHAMSKADLLKKSNLAEADFATLAKKEGGWPQAARFLEETFVTTGAAS